MKTLVETSLFNLFASYTNGAGPALGELPAAYDDFVNCLATLSPAGDLTGQLRCLNYTKIELAFMRQACNGMAEDCRNILYDVFIDKTLALLDAEAEILKEMLRHGTVSAGFHSEEEQTGGLPETHYRQEAPEQRMSDSQRQVKHAASITPQKKEKKQLIL